MKKTVVLSLHVGFWICYLLIIIIVLAVYFRSSNQMVDQSFRVTNALKTILLFSFLPSFVTFYMYYRIIFLKYLQQKKFLMAVISGVLISVFVATLGYILLRFFIETGRIVDMDNSGKNGRSTAINVIVVMSIISTISGIGGLVIKGFITWYDELKLKEDLRQKNHETEMALVKAQLDPHFLFNTLNNIDVLILKDANEASNYLNKLSDILRFMLYETKTEEILLSKEIEYIKKYIDLQKIRTANTNYVNFEIIGETANKLIAPMVFIPFIENAFKHTTNKKTDHAIMVKIVITNDQIDFTCQNKFDSNRKKTTENNGLGNELIKKRLNLIYQSNHTLKIEKEQELFSVKLTIKNG